MTDHGQSGDTAVPAVSARRSAGKRACLSGGSAEKTVAAAYDDLGLERIEMRWRGQGGEIDLILRDGETYVFAEVKKARTHDQAIARLRPAQMRRIHAAASEYLALTPGGQLSDVRFDLAVMDADGRVEILKNAFGHF